MFTFSGELPPERLPPGTEFPGASFTLWRAICAVLREDHLFHVEGILPSSWHITPCERAIKHTISKDLAFRGLIFFPLDGASCLLGLGTNVTEASRLLFSLLSSRVPPYDKVLEWLHFSYTGDMFGAYVDPASKEFLFCALT